MERAWMGREGERLVDGVVAEMVALCPWMDVEDASMFREVMVAHFGLVAGEEVDVGVMAGALLVLAERAEAVGDRRRAWAFTSGPGGRMQRCEVRSTTSQSFRRGWQRCREER